MLDVNSTTKGFLMPRMTTVQKNAIVNPANGLMIFNTDSNNLEIFNGAVWNTTTLSGGTIGLGFSSPNVTTAGGDAADISGILNLDHSLPDTLGAHLMTTNLVTDGNFISGDGDNEGLSVNFNGQVFVNGSTTGNTNLLVNGMVRTTNQGSGLELTNTQITITGNNGNTGDMRFKTGSTDRIRLTGAGLVGIGTMNPTTQLQIEGSSTSSTIRLTNSATASNGLYVQSNSSQAALLNYENKIGRAHV